MTAPDPALVARFHADLAVLPGSEGRLLLAVSGGADSLAMLLLAHAAIPDQIACATVDHGLRVEAATEAAMVAAVCVDLGVQHETLTVTPPWLPGEANIQARARRARYHMLARYCEANAYPAILTAHQADDQAETFLMRANRGAGMPGLSGVRTVSRVRCCDHTTQLLRPLLGWRRSTLQAIVENGGLQAIDDPSNHNTRFDRTRVRTLLKSADWIDVRRIAAAAAYVAEANDELEAITMAIATDRTRKRVPDEWQIDVAGLPREMTRRLVRMGIGSVRAMAGIDLPEWNEGHSVEPLLDALEAGKGATQGGVQASAKGAIWHFREAPPRRSH